MDRPSQDLSALVVFAEGEVLCALPASEVQEVVFLPELSHPPGLPPVLDGVMTLDGKAVPVVRAARLMGLEPADDDIYTPAMILKDVGAAISAQRLLGILRPTAADLVAADTGRSFNGCVSGMTHMKGHEVHILSAQRLLLEEEKRRLKEFGEIAERRLAEMADGAS